MVRSPKFMLFSSKKNEAKKLAALLQLGPGSVVADVGSGKGEYAVTLAGVVGQNGTVYAVEADKERLSLIGKKVSALQLANIKTIQSSDISVNLPPLTCDAIFLRGAYHHLNHPEEILASISASLKAGGRLAIIDFPPRFFLSLFFPVKNVSKNRGGHGVPKEIVIKEVTRVGLQLEEKIDKWMPGRYCLLFQKQK